MKGKNFNIKVNDLVMVVSGKERGKSGRILKVFPKKNRVIVEKINFIKRHTRPGSASRQGGILEKEGTIHISNVMILCDKCNRPVRVGHLTLEDGKKVRVCKRCGEVIDKK
ncbi:MAG: 50S ribosomal protein L24 [Deltaproteobacteria bacterium]|nr:50S ribosomal protein L24 [Deltaproteobacteria bacterium]RLA91480.1 MAG: 50S ribosomal protein L24 [Deltaproteobacteria bacterium]